MAGLSLCRQRVLDSFFFVPHCPVMSDRDGDSASAAAPPLLDERTSLALRREFARRVACGIDAHNARRAARDLLTGLRPSLPFTMLDDGAAVALAAEGG